MLLGAFLGFLTGCNTQGSISSRDRTPACFQLGFRFLRAIGSWPHRRTAFPAGATATNREIAIRAAPFCAGICMHQQNQ